jgi:hypothetical protein
MDFLDWAMSPWGQRVPIHIAWFLIWVAVIAGLLFFFVHATYVRYFAKAKEFAGNVSPAEAARIPEHVPRHSLTARLFHWIMAASMFTLLFTAFLPRVGVQFPWVTYHWIAGTVLTASRQVRQISFREQALPWRHHRRRPIRNYYRCVHDVARAHHFLSPQSVSVQ